MKRWRKQQAAAASNYKFIRSDEASAMLRERAAVRPVVRRIDE